MTSIGEVKAIIDENHLLLSASEELAKGDRLAVFSVVKHPKLWEVLKKDHLVFPIGEIKIVSEQAENIYLAERFREVKERRRQITTPSALQSAFSWYVGETKEVVEEVPGLWSVEFDMEKSLGIEVPKAITVGDIVGRI